MPNVRAWDRLVTVVVHHFVVLYLYAGLGVTLTYAGVSALIHGYDVANARSCYQQVTSAHGAPYDCATASANGHVVLMQIDDINYALYFVAITAVVASGVYYHWHLESSRHYLQKRIWLPVPFLVSVGVAIIMAATAVVWLFLYA